MTEKKETTNEASKPKPTKPMKSFNAKPPIVFNSKSGIAASKGIKPKIHRSNQGQRGG